VKSEMLDNWLDSKGALVVGTLLVKKSCYIVPGVLQALTRELMDLVTLPKCVPESVPPTSILH